MRSGNPAKGEDVHFVMVHGIGGGSWCWYKVRCLLESSGYMVSCVDLKGAGINPSSPDSVLSFDDYNQPLLDFISSLPHHHQVVVVGHSAGGLSVTQASIMFPDKVRLGVYVAATMLEFGFQTQEDILHGVPDLSPFGEDVYDLGFGLGPDKPPTTALVKKHLQRQIIYHMSPPEDSTLAEMLLRPGPVQAIMGAQFEESVAQPTPPRVYVKTSQDKVVKPEQQDAMVERWPPSQVYVMDTDHSPFFSSPFVLVGILVKAVASLCL